MIQSYILRKADDLNEIDLNDNDFYLIITLYDSGWIRFYIRPDVELRDIYNVFDNCNNFVDNYSSIVDAVKKCYNQIYFEIYG